MFSEKEQNDHPHRKFRWSLVAVTLLLLALSTLIIYGFDISARPSPLYYPLLSVVREIRLKAGNVQSHLQQIKPKEGVSDQTGVWNELAQAVWHLDIMLGKPAGADHQHIPVDSVFVYQGHLEKLKSLLSAWQSASESNASVRPASIDNPTSVSTAAIYEELLGEVGAIEASMTRKLNRDRWEFRLTIIGLTILSFGMVIFAGQLFWRFENQQILIQVMLNESKEELISKVEDRTRLLTSVNHQLTLEIEEHKKTEEKLLHYEERLRRLNLELLQTQELERRRIATEIHDRIGQALAIAKIKMGALQAMLEAPLQIATLNDIRELVTQTIKDTRTLTFELSPPVLYELGFEAAVEWLAESIQKQSGLAVYIQRDKDNVQLEIERRVFLFKAVRELLLNVVKHAQARRVELLISSQPDILTIEVIDDGRGCDMFAEANSKDYQNHGFGLFSLREQLRHYGGRLIFHSKPGMGTHVIITIPKETIG